VFASGRPLSFPTLEVERVPSEGRPWTQGRKWSDSRNSRREHCRPESAGTCCRNRSADLHKLLIESGVQAGEPGFEPGLTGWAEWKAATVREEFSPMAFEIESVEAKNPRIVRRERGSRSLNHCKRFCGNRSWIRKVSGARIRICLPPVCTSMLVLPLTPSLASLICSHQANQQRDPFPQKSCPIQAAGFHKCKPF